MISLVLPYWNRQEATELGLESIAKHYAGTDLEVVVVDDGSPTPFVVPDLPIDIKVVRLSAKLVPLSPCVPINRGVAAAKGELIGLSNPETVHLEPVLREMMIEIERGGPKTYVMAAAWCPEQLRWHCHSSRVRGDIDDVGSLLPVGADYHFMSMMHRSLWDAAGGFDEDYRQGHCYEDADFVKRLKKAWANFVMRDDLVVNHPRAGAKSVWVPHLTLRNRALFMEKWSP